jgi:hypothetical protein
MTTPSNKPSHRVYAVAKRGDTSDWTEIGAVWPHRDGKGFNLKLSFLPLNGADVVIREPLPKADDADASNMGGV